MLCINWFNILNNQQTRKKKKKKKKKKLKHYNRNTNPAALPSQHKPNVLSIRLQFLTHSFHDFRRHNSGTNDIGFGGHKQDQKGACQSVQCSRMQQEGGLMRL